MWTENYGKDKKKLKISEVQHMKTLTDVKRLKTLAKMTKDISKSDKYLYYRWLTQIISKQTFSVQIQCSVY